MDHFKSVIQRRNFILKCVVFIVIILNVIMNFIPIDPQWDATIGFQMGPLIGVALIGILGVYKYSRVLKDDDELKKLQISEHDERKKMIKQKTCQSSLITVIVVLLLVTCVMIYFDQSIAFALIGVIYGILFITFAFKIYYSKKF